MATLKLFINELTEVMSTVLEVHIADDTNTEIVQ